QLIGSAVDLEFARNRFFQLGDGFFYRTHRGPEDRIIPQPRIQLTLESNTFADLQGAALHFEALPQRTDKPAEKSQLVVKNNLFDRTALLAQVDISADVQIKQPATLAKRTWFHEQKV